jgi:hypothetical protein
VDLGGRGLLFVGHSEAGKSTIAGMLKGTAEILCDDRVIVRRHADGIRIHGTWSHGDIPDVSSRSVPLHGIFFLVQAPLNRITRMQSVSASASRLLECLVKPYTSADWWEKELALVERIVSETPCYKLEFDRSGGIVALLLEV